MHVNDFHEFDIVNFTAEQISDTGAKIADVSLITMLRLQAFAALCPLKILLLKNGLTSGDHSSPLHPRGYAVDIAFDIEPTKIKIYDQWKNAIQAGFFGIGIYWNGVTYSMHLDTRKNIAFWSGRKNPLYNPDDANSKYWIYSGVFLDPKIK